MNSTGFSGRPQNQECLIRCRFIARCSRADSVLTASASDWWVILPRGYERERVDDSRLGTILHSLTLVATDRTVGPAWGVSSGAELSSFASGKMRGTLARRFTDTQPRLR